MGAWIEEQKKDGKLNPGLEEQLDIQLRILKDKDVPDVEFVSFPGYMSFPSKSWLPCNLRFTSESHDLVALPENKNHVRTSGYPLSIRIDLFILFRSPLSRSSSILCRGSSSLVFIYLNYTDLFSQGEQS